MLRSRLLVSSLLFFLSFLNSSYNTLSSIIGACCVFSSSFNHVGIRSWRIEKFHATPARLAKIHVATSHGRGPPSRHDLYCSWRSASSSYTWGVEWSLLWYFLEGRGKGTMIIYITKKKYLKCWRVFEPGGTPTATSGVGKIVMLVWQKEWSLFGYFQRLIFQVCGRISAFIESNFTKLYSSIICIKRRTKWWKQ